MPGIRTSSKQKTRGGRRRNRQALKTMRAGARQRAAERAYREAPTQEEVESKVKKTEPLTG